MTREFLAEVDNKRRALKRYTQRCARTKRVVKSPKVHKPLNEREKIQFKEPSPTLAWEIMTGFRG
jgi:hypothetical protein